MSPEKSLFLGLDVGTQGTKGVVVDSERQEIVARAAVSYDLIEGLPPGAAEQHPDMWIESVCHVTRELFADESLDSARVAGIGVSGQQHGLVVLDATDRVVRPAKLWCDTSTAEEARELSTRFGRSVPTGFTASKILWLKHREPESWAKTRTVLLPHDYVNFRLTGEKTMEAGDASGTGLFEPAARAFRMDDVRALDERLVDMLPPLLAPGALVGRLSTDGAALLGLRQGIPVSAGGGDNMLSAVGSGATRPGVFVLSLGTSGTVFTWSEQPVIDAEGLIAPFCASVGGWLPLLCVMNATGVAEEVVQAFDTDHATLTEEARAVPRGCNGLTWLPYLAGERVPDLPAATGVLTGMRAGSLQRGTLYRAALEGTSLNLAWGVDRMRALGLAPDEVRLVGGAATNPLWGEILADALGCPVVPLAEAEAAALGAALQAVWSVRLAAGEDASIDQLCRPYVRHAGASIEPTEEGQRCHAALGERFRELVRHTFGDRA